MTDDETILLLNAYCDDELSPGEALDMERRLAADPALRAAAGRLRALSGAVRGVVAQPPAPATLRSRIVSAVGFNDAPRRATWGSWQSLAAAILVGVFGGSLIGGGATYLRLAPGLESTTDAVLAGHWRGLAAPQPFDIASSNRHVVKPWFNGRTTVAPQAPDLAEHGFPLAGGRIDIVGGKPVPTLVYRHDQHVISVTVVATSTGAGAGEDYRDGTAVERWTAGDLTYWTVSDLDTKELRNFAELFRAQTGE